MWVLVDGQHTPVDWSHWLTWAEAKCFAGTVGSFNSHKLRVFDVDCCGGSGSKLQCVILERLKIQAPFSQTCNPFTVLRLHQGQPGFSSVTLAHTFTSLICLFPRQNTFSYTEVFCFKCTVLTLTKKSKKKHTTISTQTNNSNMTSMLPHPPSCLRHPEHCTVPAHCRPRVTALPLALALAWRELCLLWCAVPQTQKGR